MDVEMVACMQNVIGRFVQNIYLEQYGKCAQLFCTSREAKLNMPESGLSLSGHDAIKQAFENMEAAIEQKEKMRYIFILCTPAFNTEKSTGSGMWNAYTFKYLPADTQILNVEPSFYRFDCDFITEGNEVKILRMDCYQLMNWQYLQCHISENSICRMPLSYDSCTTVDSEDFVQLENLISRMTHSAMEEIRELFVDDPQSEFYLSAHMEAPAVGYKNIVHVVDALNEKSNPSLLWCVPYTSAPVIATKERHGWGRWLVMSMDFCDSDTGYSEKQPCAVRRIGFVDGEFIKTKDGWKIYKYHLNVREVFHPRQVKNEACKKLWKPPASKGIKPAKAKDVFEIQSVIPEWTQRLMTGRLHEFPEQFMAPDEYEPTFWLGAPGILQKGRNAIMNECLRMDVNYKNNLYKTPIIHTAMAPLIEISECGTIAWAQWMDQCSSDLSQMTGDYTLPLPAMMNTWKYQHVFKKIDSEWKLLHFRGFLWSELEFIYADPQTWNGWVALDSVQWPMPFERYPLIDNS